MYRLSFTQYSHSKHMVESTELSLLLISHMITGTEEVMCMEAGTDKEEPEGLGERTTSVCVST